VELLSGQVQMLFANPPDVLGHIRAGKLRAIVSTGPKRIPLLPDVPTIAEEGFHNAESVSFFVVAAPRGTPKEVVSRLYATFSKVGKEPEIRKRMIELGTEPEDKSPEESAAFIDTQAAKWARVIKESGAKVEE